MVLHKEHTGGDHVAVTWQRPGAGRPVDGAAGIPAEFLSCIRGGNAFTHGQRFPLAVTPFGGPGQHIRNHGCMCNDLDGDAASLRVTTDRPDRVVFSGRRIVYTGPGDESITYRPFFDGAHRSGRYSRAEPRGSR